jgi:uncharacterized cupredoxin-like copper-binding protein
VPLALSTGHEVGLAVTAAAFIIFALASSFLFPRFWADYPGRALLAFVVVSLVFFFGMLSAVEVFGAESEGEHAAAGETSTEATTTATTTTTATSTTPTTTAPATPPPASQAQTVPVSESEFKIVLPRIALKAGKITFDVKNVGKIPHDLAVKGTSFKSNLIQPGGSTKLTATLKPGSYELYCTVPGHEAAGMKVNITVTSAATSTAPTTTAPATPPPASQAQTVPVSESEFKIVLPRIALKAGKITFDVKNVGKIPHDLAVKGTSFKSNLIQPGGSTKLTATLKPGSYELYCTVPGHEAAGMKVNVTVS